MQGELLAAMDCPQVQVRDKKLFAGCVWFVRLMVCAALALFSLFTAIANCNQSSRKTLNTALFSIVLLVCCTIQVSSNESQKYSSSSLNSFMDCFNFSTGDEKTGEFYSPNYPNNYPNSSDCAKLISAPPGKRIKLEFRDHFDLEESPTCEYDKLEIRDGRYGYDKVLATLCGHNFPPEIYSSDRYLWLRFKSDASIEYAGFKAIYKWDSLPEPTKPEPKDCHFYRVGHSGKLVETDVHQEIKTYSRDYFRPLDCIWNITVSPHLKMYINFLNYELAKPNDCDSNYFDIYENVLSEDTRKMQFCGTSTEPYKSDGNIVNIRLHAKHTALDFRFQILFTAFRETVNKEQCTDDEFDCDDGTCIHKTLKCDGYDNCKYRYDEDKATTCHIGKKVLSLTSEHMIVILIVFFALVIGMCASIVVSCWGKIQERRQRELEYRSRNLSRDGSMEQGLDRTITSTSLNRSLEIGFPVKGATIFTRGPQKNNNGIIDCQEEDNNSCYVPDVTLNYYRKQPNGDPSSIIDEKYIQETNQINDLISPDCPYYHQHRESIRSGSESPIPPPPPPPILSHLRARAAQRASTLPLDVSELDSPSPIDNHHGQMMPSEAQMQHHPDCAQH